MRRCGGRLLWWWSAFYAVMGLCSVPTSAGAAASNDPVGTVTKFTDPSISYVQRIAAGPDGNLWFTNAERLDRADHARRGRVELPGRHHHRVPTGSRPARTGTCGSPTGTTRSGGSPRPASSPNYTGTGIAQARTGSRPAPTATCGSPTAANHSIGRITPTGVITELHRHRHHRPRRDRGRPGRQPVVHQRRATTDRADHPDRRRHQLHRHRHLAPTGDRGRPGRQPLVHQRRQRTRSVGSPRPASCTNFTGTGISGSLRDRGRPGRQPVVHQLVQPLDRADHPDRCGHRTSPAPASRTRTGSQRVRTTTCGSPTRATTRSGGSWQWVLRRSAMCRRVIRSVRRSCGWRRRGSRRGLTTEPSGRRTRWVARRWHHSCTSTRGNPR